MFDSLTRDKFKLSAETDCMGPPLYYDLRSELILFANSLLERVKADSADIKKR